MVDVRRLVQLALDLWDRSEPEALKGAEDITQHGGWRAYMASLQKSRAATTTTA